MASSRTTRSSGPVLSNSHGCQRSISPTGRFYPSRSSTPVSSSSSRYGSHSDLFRRSASPTRVNLCGSVSAAASMRFSFDRSISPNRALTGLSVSPRKQIIKKQDPLSGSSKRRTCMCSPTTHPGSFRCSLHKNFSSGSSTSNRLNARRSAMTNSLVRIGTVEGEWVKRALAALIRPSSHRQRRRADFQPRPSRLSVMSMTSGCARPDFGNRIQIQED